MSIATNTIWPTTVGSEFELIEYFKMVFLKILQSANMAGFPRAGHIQPETSPTVAQVAIPDLISIEELSSYQHRSFRVLPTLLCLRQVT